MTCQTCQFYRPDTCRRRSPSATGWPVVQPDDMCGEWEAAVTIPEAMQQLGETIGKIRDVVGAAGGWRNDRLPTAEDAGSDGHVWIWSQRHGKPVIHEAGFIARRARWRGNLVYWASGNQPAPTTPPPSTKPTALPPSTWRFGTPLSDETDADGCVWVWRNDEPCLVDLASQRTAWGVDGVDLCWAPGHEPAPTDPPPGAALPAPTTPPPPPNVIVGRDAEVRLEPKPKAEQPVNQWRNDRPPESGDLSEDGTVWVWTNSIDGQPYSVEMSWEAMIQFSGILGKIIYWAPGNLPAPTDSPPSWESLGIPTPTDSPPDAEPPAPPAPRWIVDRAPTAEDGNDDGDVAALMRPGLDGVYGCVTWQCVYPGTPWAPTNAIPDEPFDPTTLDRNGWVRSRLPGEGDDKGQEGWVQIPGFDPGLVIWAPLAHIVPGQPWAPADSEPGEYQP